MRSVLPRNCPSTERHFTDRQVVVGQRRSSTCRRSATDITLADVGLVGGWDGWNGDQTKADAYQSPDRYRVVHKFACNRIPKNSSCQQTKRIAITHHRRSHPSTTDRLGSKHQAQQEHSGLLPAGSGRNYRPSSRHVLHVADAALQRAQAGGDVRSISGVCSPAAVTPKVWSGRLQLAQRLAEARPPSRVPASCASAGSGNSNAVQGAVDVLVVVVAHCGAEFQCLGHRGDQFR